MIAIILGELSGECPNRRLHHNRKFLIASARVSSGSGRSPTTMATTFNIYSKCYSGRLLVSLCIEVDSNQLTIQDYDFTRPHAAVLRHGNITIDSGLLQNYLSAECILSHMHNVARVKRDRNRPFFEIDITNLANLEHFCKSLEGITIYHTFICSHSIPSIFLCRGDSSEETL